MKWRDMGILAFKNALRSGYKTVLCILAVCVGIASVYLIGEICCNAEQQIANEIKKSGLGGVMVFAQEEEAALTIGQIRQLSKDVPQIEAAMPIFSEYGDFKLRNLSGNALVWGVDEQFQQIFHVQLLHGRLPSEQEVRQCAKVAVIEDTLAQKAYQRHNVVGKEIVLTLNGMPETYTIIGVITSQKSGVNALIGGDKLPAFAYIPYTTANLCTGKETTGQLALSYEEQADTQAITTFALGRLERQQGSEFSAENIGGYVDTFSSILQMVSVLITLIGGISLLVGGIGVMNSMIAAVEGRRREIGIYMAIGARRRDIVGCYLLESILICLFGGIAGGIFGGGLLFLGAHALGVALEFHLRYLLLAESAALGCGLLFGILPAFRAANMSPIAAMR